MFQKFQTLITSFFNHKLRENSTFFYIFTTFCTTWNKFLRHFTRASTWIFFGNRWPFLHFARVLVIPSQFFQIFSFRVTSSNNFYAVSRYKVRIPSLWQKVAVQKTAKLKVTPPVIDDIASGSSGSSMNGSSNSKNEETNASFIMSAVANFKFTQFELKAEEWRYYKQRFELEVTVQGIK